MNLLPALRDFLIRIAERKKRLLLFAVLFLLAALCGILFIKTPAIYEYHLNLCDRFVDRVCYSDRNVFVIFLERTAGHVFLLALICLSGIHPAALVLSPLVLFYRAYTFGGTLYVFFSVYRFSGAVIVFALYLPVHLLIDAVFLSAAALSLSRARRFRFGREDFGALFTDFLLLAAAVAAVCLLEMLLLFALFHPLGNIL